MPECAEEAERLATYVRSLGTRFTFHREIDGQYDHIGATIADAILQANRNYELIVRPRVEQIRSKYTNAKTLNGLRELLTSVPVNCFLDYKSHQRCSRFSFVIDLFYQEGIDTEADLRRWLKRDDSREKLMSLPGIGQKTADYFKILCGLPSAAPDIRLTRFLNEAGITCNDYNDAKEIIHRTADLLGEDWAHFDHSIWCYMDPNARSGSIARLPRFIAMNLDLDAADTAALADDL